MVLAREHMAYHALDRYEVANYAYPGHESRHNTVYWTGAAYLGIGPGAHSMLPYAAFEIVADAEGWTPADPALGAEPPVRVRFAHALDTDAYVRDPLARPRDEEYLDAAEAAREDVMLGLRLTKGVGAGSVTAALLDAVVERLASMGLVERCRDAEGAERCRTTERGWLLGNEVFGAVWAGE